MATTQPEADSLKREEHGDSIEDPVDDHSYSTSIRGSGTIEGGEEPYGRCTRYTNYSTPGARSRLNPHSPCRLCCVCRDARRLQHYMHSSNVTACGATSSRSSVCSQTVPSSGHSRVDTPGLNQGQALIAECQGVRQEGVRLGDPRESLRTKFQTICCTFNPW